MLEKEPPDPENPILKMDNVILSPHVGSASSRMEPERRRRVGREIALVLRGRWPPRLRQPVQSFRKPTSFAGNPIRWSNV